MKTTIILFLLSVPVWAVLAYVVFLIIKALRKYIRSEPLRQEKAEQAKTLGETLKRRRTACKMTQEFVAEALGVSRQAVSPSGNPEFPIVKDTTPNITNPRLYDTA